jgi:hypothetical protein
VLVHAVATGMTAHNEEDQTPSLRRHGQQVTVAAGYCGPGEAGDFLRQHWDKDSGRVLIDGRVPINSHGGSLSEGATQGSGHLREAVHQLQGLAGQRQIAGAERAIVTAGGFFFNSQGVTLRRD